MYKFVKLLRRKGLFVIIIPHHQMESFLSIWWGMLCPLYGYPFDRAFSAQIAHSVPKVVRGTTDATLPCRGAQRFTGENRRCFSVGGCIW